MEINYKSRKLKKILENHKKIIKQHGSKQAKKITQRMNELYASTSLQDIHFNKAARLHSLSGKYKNCFSVDIIHPYRLIFKPENGNKDDLKTITSVKIIEIVDYH